LWKTKTLRKYGLTALFPVSKFLSRLQVYVLGFFGAGAMPSDPSLERSVFEPEATAAMGEAFDAACNGLQGAGKAKLCELIAKRIVAAASRGELDPVRLRAAGLG
jgi:hypothetical protein